MTFSMYCALLGLFFLVMDVSFSLAYSYFTGITPKPGQVGTIDMFRALTVTFVTLAWVCLFISWGTGRLL